MEDKAVYFDELKKFGGPMGEKGGNGTSDEYFWLIVFIFD